MILFNDDYKKKLGDLRKKEEEELASILSKKYGLQYVDLTGIPINTDALRLVSEKEAREKKLAPFKILGKKLSIAVLSPKNDATMAIVKGLEERNYQPKNGKKLFHQFAVQQKSLFLQVFYGEARKKFLLLSKKQINFYARV